MTNTTETKDLVHYPQQHQHHHLHLHPHRLAENAEAEEETEKNLRNPEAENPANLEDPENLENHANKYI
jgi:hypothetical protein